MAPLARAHEDGARASRALVGSGRRAVTLPPSGHQRGTCVSRIKAREAHIRDTMIFANYRMGYLGRQTVHGFRGLASTWANEAECYKPDWIEMALAHEDEDVVRGAYNSALYLSPRRRMLQDWANMIDNAVGVACDCSTKAQIGTSPLADQRQIEGESRGLLPPVRQPFWQRSRRIPFGASSRATD